MYGPLPPHAPIVPLAPEEVERTPLHSWFYHRHASPMISLDVENSLFLPVKQITISNTNADVPMASRSVVADLTNVVEVRIDTF